MKHKLVLLIVFCLFSAFTVWGTAPLADDPSGLWAHSPIPPPIPSSV